MRLLTVTLAFSISAFAGYLGPSPYSGFNDSPFNGLSFQYFHLDPFSGAPHPAVQITGSTSILTPGPMTDSVDEDDGTVDGSGTDGTSLYTTQGAVRFAFDATLLGGVFPTHAGIVWTDVGQNTPTFGVANVSFEAWDAGGTSLGVFGPYLLGDGSVLGATAEDRFFGVTNAGGISAIELRVPSSTDWEMDHLQFGAATTAIPEPGSAGLALAGLGLLAGFLRRRRIRS